MGKREKPRKGFEFSKLILCFETLLVGYVSHRVLGFVGEAIQTGFTGSLPYLTTFITAVWAAYGASVSFYQNKSGKENVEKVRAGVAPSSGPSGHLPPEGKVWNETPDC